MTVRLNRIRSLTEGSETFDVYEIHPVPKGAETAADISSFVRIVTSPGFNAVLADMEKPNVEVVGEGKDRRLRVRCLHTDNGIGEGVEFSVTSSKLPR